MQLRFLDPKVLGGISGLDLVAKTVVDGFVAGLHRSPDFGFSQEFAEYRAYMPGDDLRHVDWNVYARTDKMFLKRYRGETNCQLTILLDMSRSMKFGSQGMEKIEYARFLAACLAYLAQRPAGRRQASSSSTTKSATSFLRRRARASSRASSTPSKAPKSAPVRTSRILSATSRNFTAAEASWPASQISGTRPKRSLKPSRPCGSAVRSWCSSICSIPRSCGRSLKHPRLVAKTWKPANCWRVSPDYVAHEYPAKIQAHVADMKARAQGAGIDYFLIDTSRPLDDALREYLAIRKGKL